MTAVATLPTARSLLFVPGDRPERFDKAAASGADVVVVDLEDAVAPERKDDARVHAATWLGGQGGARAVRVNAPGTEWFSDDLAAVADHPCVVVVPKAECAEVLEDVAARLAPGSALLALVETASGVVQASAVARARGVVRLAFGSFDLAAELGVSPEDREAMAWSRGALVVASAAGGLAAPVDGVTADVGDADLLRDDVGAAVRLGFSGKLCIHPRQVPVVHDALRPTPGEVAWAEEVVAAAGRGGVAVVAGRMVDRPVVERARRLIARARRP